MTEEWEDKEIRRLVKRAENAEAENDALSARIAELEAERETWHAWAKQVRKLFATYISGPMVDKLLAAAPDATVANAAPGEEG